MAACRSGLHLFRNDLLCQKGCRHGGQLLSSVIHNEASASSSLRGIASERCSSFAPLLGRSINKCETAILIGAKRTDCDGKIGNSYGVDPSLQDARAHHDSAVQIAAQSSGPTGSSSSSAANLQALFSSVLAESYSG